MYDKNDFRPIPGFPDYSINVWGEVLSNRYFREPRMLKPFEHKKTGRMYVLLCRGKLDTMEHLNKQISRLVLETFIGPCPDGMECCHNDGDRKNNHISNLRWDTRENNLKDRLKHGTIAYGEKNPMSKLTKDMVLQIRKEYESGKKQVEISRRFNISFQQVSRIVNKERWSHI